MRTKGRDHMQLQIIPVPLHLCSSNNNTSEDHGGDAGATAVVGAVRNSGRFANNPALMAFLTTIKHYNLNFFEIHDPDVSVDDVVLTVIEGGPYQEYFYVEIPLYDECTREMHHKRFVYVPVETPAPALAAAADVGRQRGRNNSRFPMHLGNEVVYSNQM